MVIYGAGQALLLNARVSRAGVSGNSCNGYREAKQMT